MKPYSSTVSRTITHRLPVIAYCFGIFRQSSYPAILSEPLFPHFDKLAHFLVYAFLAVLCVRALQAEKPFWPPLRSFLMAVVFCCAFGLSDEIHQAFVPLRDASVFDFAADCLGSLSGAYFYLNFRTARTS